MTAPCNGSFLLVGNLIQRHVSKLNLIQNTTSTSLRAARNSKILSFASNNRCFLSTISSYSKTSTQHTNNYKIHGLQIRNEGAMKMPIFNIRELKKLHKDKKKLEKMSRNPHYGGFSQVYDVFKHYLIDQTHLPLYAQMVIGESLLSNKPLRGEVVLPETPGKKKEINILVFAQGKDAELAKSLNATYVGGPELIKDLVDGKLVVDKVLSTKAMFPNLVKVAKVLGPKGLMPSPARGTVSDDVAFMLGSLKSVTPYGLSEDKSVHVMVGLAGWSAGQVEKNLIALYESVYDTVLANAPKGKASTSTSPVTNIHLYAPFTPALLVPLQGIISKSTIATKSNEDDF